jgi:hypothetical protein
MILNLFAWFMMDKVETITRFGAARLVKTNSGKIELIGGSRDDRRAAREWCSLFLHEATFACAA